MSGGGTAFRPASGEEAAFRKVFELRCADVHPCRCAAVFYGKDPDELVAQAREHGALVHGFTPVFYTPERLVAMRAAAMKARRWRTKRNFSLPRA